MGGRESKTKNCTNLHDLIRTKGFCENFHLSPSHFLLLSPAPSQSPDAIIAYNSSSQSLLVEWSHLSEQDFNGQRIGYKISYYPVDRSWEIRNVTVNYRTNHTKVTTNLTVFTEYVITVSAVSSGGVGPGISTTARTGDEGTVIYLRMLCLMQRLEC